MQLIADLHIHSHFSRATSRNLVPESLAQWAQLKGVHLVATGDLTHPGWLAELREKLIPAEEGLFRLHDDLAGSVEAHVPPACRGTVRFMLSGEISNIYKRNERTRKVHNVVYTPSFEAAERLQARLEKIGNIRSDGRPILGLDARDLLEIVLEVGPGCHLIPAHIWTPWFSLLGSKSGIDSVGECFADLTPHIFALETGLSSDPPMNWRVSALDQYKLVSNSDAHSPEKLGREATLFDTDLSYAAVFEALTTKPCAAGEDGIEGQGCCGTIEFFPEEGKYHFDGHRACGIAWDPQTTLAHNGICPVCGKQVTVGVMHRVEMLADRFEGGRPPQPCPFHSLVPLPELLGEMYGVGDSSRQVQAEYARLLVRLGPELAILRNLPLADIATAGGERLASGIGRMRRGEVTAQPGYDGEYGVIRVFGAASRLSEGQMGLWAPDEGRKAGDKDGNIQPAPSQVREEKDRRTAEERDAQDAEPEHPGEVPPNEVPAGHLTPFADDASHLPDHAADWLASLNDQQRTAVRCVDAPLLIVAGPGTGKTRTLTARMAFLILEKGVPPEAVLAITFTNKAAGEMRERLEGLLGQELAGRVTIKTFHAFGALLLREHAGRLGIPAGFTILAEEERTRLLRRVCPDLSPDEVETCLEYISAVKSRGVTMPGVLPGVSSSATGPGLAAAAHLPENAPRSFDLVRAGAAYEAALRTCGAIDFDDLILLPIRLLEEHCELLAGLRERYRWISVDEYQDVNLAQYRLLRLLTAPPASVREADSGRTPNLCVIGDPDQAIYGFRGADRSYFLRFEQDYPGAVVLSLSRNYRSTQIILDAAMQVIGHGRDEGWKTKDESALMPATVLVAGKGTRLQAVQVLSDFADAVKLDVHRAPTDRAEAEYVVHQIEQMVGGTSHFSLDSGRVSGETPAAARSFADFAVLYRLSGQSHLLAEAFERSGIPYQTANRQPLTGHAVVREALAHLWLLLQPGSPVHAETVLTASRAAFGPRAVNRVLRCSGSDGSPWPFAAAAASEGFSAGQRARLAALAAFHRELAQESGTRVAHLVERIRAFITQERGPSADSADAELLQQLARCAAPFEDRLADFLEAAVMRSETDAYDPRADRVALMSLHASKGLEFPVVFIVGCEEGLLPYRRSKHTPDIEEERRLFYVGLTRARQKLILTCAVSRVLFGQHMENPVSRFVEDIEAALKQVQEITQKRAPRKNAEAQLSLF